MDRGRKRKGYMQNGNKEQRKAQMRMGEKKRVRDQKREKTTYHSASSLSPHIYYILLYYFSIILAIWATLLLLLCLTHLRCPAISEERNTYIFLS